MNPDWGIYATPLGTAPPPLLSSLNLSWLSQPPPPSEEPNTAKKWMERQAKLRKNAISSFNLRGTRRLVQRPPLAKAETQGKPGRPLPPASSYLHFTPANLNTGAGMRFNIRMPPFTSTLASDRTTLARDMRDSHFIRPEVHGLAEWLERQKAYVTGLPKRDRDILASYSSHGDRLVNSYCRGTLTHFPDLLARTLEHDKNIPLAYSIYDQYDGEIARLAEGYFGEHWRTREVLVKKNGELDMGKIRSIIFENMEYFSHIENVRSLLEQYKQDLIRIIDAAPRSRKRLVLYRGIQDESHVKTSRFRNQDFLSTSVLPGASLTFAKRYEMPLASAATYVETPFIGGVYEFTLDPNIPCIYMEYVTSYPTEYEVLLPPGLEITLGKKIFMKSLHTSDFITADRFLKATRTEVLTVHGQIKAPTKGERLKFDILIDDEEVPRSRKGRKSRKSRKSTGLDKHAKPFHTSCVRNLKDSRNAKKKFRRWSRRRHSSRLSTVSENGGSGRSESNGTNL